MIFTNVNSQKNIEGNNHGRYLTMTIGLACPNLLQMYSILGALAVTLTEWYPLAAPIFLSLAAVMGS